MAPPIALGPPPPAPVCICWACGEPRNRPDWWPNVVPGKCTGGDRHWWVWAQEVDGRPDLATSRPLGCGVGQLLAAMDAARQALAAQTSAALKAHARRLNDGGPTLPLEGSRGEQLHVSFAHDESTDLTLVTVSAREFLCGDLLRLLKEYLPDADLLHSRLVCSKWAAQDQQEWHRLVRCIKRYRRELRPVQLREYSLAAAHKVGGGLVVLGGAALGLGTLLGCLYLLRVGQLPALPFVGRMGAACAIAVTDEGVNLMGQETPISRMPTREQILTQERAAYKAAGADFVEVTAADVRDELALLPYVHAKYAPRRDAPP